MPVGSLRFETTGLLTRRAPFLMKSFKSWKTEPAAISEPAIGKMPDGEFRTKALKGIRKNFAVVLLKLWRTTLFAEGSTEFSFSRDLRQ